MFLLLCYLISGRDRQESIVINHLESTAYRNKISLKLGYRTVNARKYVRYARNFYSVCFLYGLFFVFVSVWIFFLSLSLSLSLSVSLCVCVSVCVCVSLCVCVKFWFPLTISKPVIYYWYRILVIYSFIQELSTATNLAS